MLFKWTIKRSLPNRFKKYRDIQNWILRVTFKFERIKKQEVDSVRDTRPYQRSYALRKPPHGWQMTYRWKPPTASSAPDYRCLRPPHCHSCSRTRCWRACSKWQARARSCQRLSASRGTSWSRRRWWGRETSRKRRRTRTVLEQADPRIDNLYISNHLLISFEKKKIVPLLINKPSAHGTIRSGA